MRPLPEIAHHITRGQDPARLCDGWPARYADIPTSDVGALREARSQAILCPECQLKSGYPPFHLRQSRYRAGNRTLAVKGGGKTYHCGGEKVYHRGNA